MAKILLVEDNELNRDMLKRRLERRGHEVSIAVDGAEDTTAEERQALKGHVQAVLQKGEYSRDGLLTRIRDLVTDHLPTSPGSDN